MFMSSSLFVHAVLPAFIKTKSLENAPVHKSKVQPRLCPDFTQCIQSGVHHCSMCEAMCQQSLEKMKPLQNNIGRVQQIVHRYIVMGLNKLIVKYFAQ